MTDLEPLLPGQHGRWACKCTAAGFTDDLERQFPELDDDAGHRPFSLGADRRISGRGHGRPPPSSSAPGPPTTR
ncbi:MAG: hypothetical protein MZW92_55540 [Comamonadaceae bacterium]|nr:hypothetical protein [Comamonadaceae bacterium]